MTPDYDLAHLLPHRPPFLLVDRLRSVDLPAGSLVAERHLGADDPLLGPLLGPPLGPLAPQDELSPLLVVEALCQAAACLNGLEALAARQRESAPEPPEPAVRHRGYLVSAAGFEFPDRARIGERLSLHVAREGRMGSMVSFRGRAEAHEPGAHEPEAGAGRLVASGRLLFAVTIA